MEHECRSKGEGLQGAGTEAPGAEGTAIETTSSLPPLDRRGWAIREQQRQVQILTERRLGARFDFDEEQGRRFFIGRL
jgi:hypothetical protein